MHPWMALWIWSEAMRRSAFGIAPIEVRDQTPPAEKAPIVVPPIDVIRAENYLQTELIGHPLPDALLDKLSDLYWTEREAELPI